MRVTGTVITVQRSHGPVLYIKARDRNGKQIKRVLGPASEWTAKQANDALRDFLVDLGRAPASPKQVMTLADATRAWLRYVEHEKERKPSTVRDYRNTLNGRVLPFYGPDRPLSTIDADSIDEFRVYLLGQVSRRTAQKILVLVHGLLKYAKRRRWIATNPAEDAEKVSVRRRTEFAVLSPVEIAAVAGEAGPLIAEAITVSAFTGLRMGELRALRWRDVDFSNRLVHVRRSVWRAEEGTTKSSKARSVPLIDQAAVALDALSRREHFTDPGDLVFTEHGSKLHDGALRDGLYAAMKAAGVDRDRGTGKLFVWHDLRHTFGTLAVQAFPLSDVQSFLGHADVTTTALYLHHVPQHDAADKFSALVAKALGTSPGTELSASTLPNSPQQEPSTAP